MEELASKIGCKVGCLSSTYLGMLFDAPFKSMVA